jgi:TatD DNase family protein
VLVDTHCHLCDSAYDADRAEVVRRAREAGVGHVVVVGESPESAALAMAFAASEPMVSATAGVHPHIAASWTPETEAWLGRCLAEPAVVAAGEMGLDYHYDHSPRDVQQRVFDIQLDLAASAGKCAIVHAREADDDVVAALKAHPRALAVLHSFSSGLPLFYAAVEMGHYVSFSGMVTFRSWTLDEAIRETPLDRMLIETDGPYLAPVPHRGRRNEPAFVGRVAQRIAEVRRMDVTDVVAATGANAARLFGFGFASTPERP